MIRRTVVITPSAVSKWRLDHRTRPRLSAKGDDRQKEKMGRLLIALGRALRINVQTPKKPKQHDPGGFGWRPPQDDDVEDDDGDEE